MAKTCNTTTCCNTWQCKGVPDPYRSQGCEEQASHVMPIIVKEYVTAYAVSADFFLPDSYTAVNINIPGLVSIQINMFIYNVDIGYLQVKEFDPMSGDLRVLEYDYNSPYSAGSDVLRGTLFSPLVYA